MPTFSELDDLDADIGNPQANDVQTLGRRARQIDDSAAIAEWPAVVDSYVHGLSRLRTYDADNRSERKSPMGGRERPRIERLAARRAPPAERIAVVSGFSPIHGERSIRAIGRLEYVLVFARGWRGRRRLFGGRAFCFDGVGCRSRRLGGASRPSVGSRR